MSEKPDVTYADIGGMAAWQSLQPPAGMELFVRECVEHMLLTIYGRDNDHGDDGGKEYIYILYHYMIL